MLDANGFDAEQHLGAVVDGDQADALVEFGAGDGTAGRRERRARPLDLDVGAEARHAQSAVAHLAVQPRAEPQQFEFGDRARGETVAARLVPRELLPRRSPARRDRWRAAHAAAAEPAGPAPITTTSAVRVVPRLPSMLDQ